MAYTVNKKISGLVPYEPIQGTYRIRLDANESFLEPGPELTAEIKNAAVSAPFNRYPDPYAEDLCRAFADAYGISTENVMAGNGSDELISLLFGTFLMKGETAVTLSPDFSMYGFYCGIAEVQQREFKKRLDFTMNPDELAAFVNSTGARMLIFSNPCNPTSVGLKREDIRRLVRSVNALVVLDEAYMDFWDQSMLSEAADFDNLIILRTCSKAVGMAALRLGFAVSNPKLIRSLKAVKSPYNVNAVSQKIGVAVLRQKEWIASCLREILASRDSLLEELRKIEKEYPGKISVPETVTNFVTVRMADSGSVYRSLLEKGIAVRCFDGFLRVTAGSKQENEEFLSAFTKALK